MLTPEQIEEQIQREDIIPYYNKVYDGFLPQSFIAQFRIAIMLIPVTAHQYAAKDVRAMCSRREGEVPTKEVGQMINVIYAVPWASMYENWEEGCDKTEEFDRIREEYNKSTSAFERKVLAKRKRLMEISGNIKSTNLNGGFKK